MLGAIIGDIVGSPYEGKRRVNDPWSFPFFSTFSHFTDDTVMTIAVGLGILDGYGSPEKTRFAVTAQMRRLGELYPHAGYGRRFKEWLANKSYVSTDSFGNGSAMRVSFVGWAYETLEEVEEYAAITAKVSHNHPEAIKAAQAVAAAIFLARNHFGKDIIRTYLSYVYDYDLNRKISDIRPYYRFNSTCQGSVPEAIIAFLDGDGFEDVIRLAVSLNGDADTQAAIAGSIAEAFYGIHGGFVKEALSHLTPALLQGLHRCQVWLNNRVN